MIRYMQHCQHRPHAGVYGDCFRSAIACILNTPPLMLPHPAEEMRNNDGTAAIEIINQVLDRGHGVRFIELPVYCGDEGLRYLRTFLTMYLPKEYTFVTGKSSSGPFNHTEIWLGGEFYHSTNHSRVVGPDVTNPNTKVIWVGTLIDFTCFT